MTVRVIPELEVDLPSSVESDPASRLIYRAIALGLATDVPTIADQTGVDKREIDQITHELLMEGRIYETGNDEYGAIPPSGGGRPTATLYIRG